MEERKEDFNQIQLNKVRTQLFGAKQLMYTLRDQIILRDKEIRELQNECKALRSTVANLEALADVFGEKVDLRKRINR